MLVFVELSILHEMLSAVAKVPKIVAILMRPRADNVFLLCCECKRIRQFEADLVVATVYLQLKVFHAIL